MTVTVLLFKLIIPWLLSGISVIVMVNGSLSESVGGVIFNIFSPLSWSTVNNLFGSASGGWLTASTLILRILVTSTISPSPVFPKSLTVTSKLSIPSKLRLLR